jgi:formylglycine-generating enzyme required for sulfatase activity/dienelactone hydrolase
MAPSRVYEPRRAADSILYQVVRDHYETFRSSADAWRDGAGLPRFIDEEFRGFLSCGWLAGGFARFRCDGCGLDRLVPFSCKGRAVCPSCGGRRMAARAAHLVDRVFPVVPVRQWVLTVPHRLRYVVAWDHGLCRAVVGVFMRTVLGWLRRRARAEGVADGRSGAVAVIQRFGAALNVNVHTHALVVDGVFAEDGSGRLQFHPVLPPSEADMDQVLATIERRVHRLLERRRVTGDGHEPDPFVETTPVLAGLTAASIEGRSATGPRPGAQVRRCGGWGEAGPQSTRRSACHAASGGFDLDAAVVVPARDRARLERVCRYSLRPPIAHDRLQWTADGDLLLALRHRWSDGTTHLRFHPLELLERLASLTPRPRINLVLYFGVLAAHASWRSRLAVPAGNEPVSPTAETRPADPSSATTAHPAPRALNYLWAQLMRRSFPLQLGAAAAVATTLVVAAVAGWIVYRDKRIQQLRQETLPRIVAMQKKTDFAAAYRLLRTVEPELVGDPEFEKTRAEVLVEASVRTSPPGADVYVKGYGEIAEEWLYLGRTPLVDMRAPFGYYRWRVQKDGYATVEGAGTLGLNNITIALQPERTLPAGMVYVPGSTVRVEQTRVELPPFYFDRYEVTNREYKRFIDAGGYRTRDYWTGPFVRDGRELSWEDALRDMRDATGHPGPSTWRLGTYPQGQDDLPVQGVSWYEAAAFARYAGKRLPTVHHWRRAAAADSLYSDVIEHSNFGTKGPAAVGAYAGIGGYGTFDLAGNVKEWTSNAVGDKRYILGGAWNEPSYQYSATDALEPFDRAAGNGFRGMTPLAGTTLDAALDRPLPSVVRDYTDERPVADSVFRIYRSLYAYDRSDLEAVVESSDDSPEHWRVERVSYAAAYRGERIPALLFLPKSAAPPYQTIVYFPAGQNIQQFHKWEINYLDFVLRSGRAVLLPMYMGIYERRLDPSIQGLHAVRDVTIQRMKDLQRSVDYVYARPDLDESRLAFFGVSLGAALAPIALAIEPRFKAAVLWSGGFSSVARLPEADQINFAPRVRTPVLMMNGRDDFTYPVKASQEPMFSWLGTPHQDKRHLLHAGGHICPFEGNIKDTLDWLDRYLGAID